MQTVSAVLLVYISSNNYQAFGFWGHNRYVGRSNVISSCGKEMKIAATSIAMPLPSSMPRDSYKEGPTESEDQQRAMEPLEGKNPITMTMEELQAKWIDICIEQSRPQDMDAFSLLNVLPLVAREHEFVVLVNKSAEAIEKTTAADASSIIFITDQELMRLWQKASLGPMGKPLDAFDSKHALLLINDEEDDSLIGEEYSSENVLALPSQLLSIGEKLKNEIDTFDAETFDEEIDGGIEYIITTDVSAVLVLFVFPCVRVLSYLFWSCNPLRNSPISSPAQGQCLGSPVELLHQINNR